MNLQEEHTKTLVALNLAVSDTLSMVTLSAKATDKAAAANALKILLECRRIEEMMQTRSTIQRVLEKLEDNAGEEGIEVLTPEQVAARMQDGFGDVGVTKDADIDVDPETETPNTE